MSDNYNSTTIKSTQNRKGRRMDASWDRQEPSRLRAQKAEDQKDKVKFERAESHRKRQEKSHAKAVIRKENAKPKSQSKKELKAALKIVKEMEAKKSKRLKFLTKQKNAKNG